MGRFGGGAIGAERAVLPGDQGADEKAETHADERQDEGRDVRFRKGCLQKRFGARADRREPKQRGQQDEEGEQRHRAGLDLPGAGLGPERRGFARVFIVLALFLGQAEGGKLETGGVGAAQRAGEDHRASGPEADMLGRSRHRLLGPAPAERRQAGKRQGADQGQEAHQR